MEEHCFYEFNVNCCLPKYQLLPSFIWKTMHDKATEASRVTWITFGCF